MRTKRLGVIFLATLSVVLVFGFVVPIIPVEVQSPCGPYTEVVLQSLFYHLIGIGYHTHTPYCQ